ncbi:MAG: hypothetical protein A4S09_17600 [Proteobacteria bacterium SG_bin7]|nr:MAG: hypothetical protein A4S09_17600 [Proteobacteria bacterium SG_bin7]
MKNLKNLILILLVGTDTAQAVPTFSCRQSKVGVIRIEQGQVTKFCADPDHKFFLKSEREESSGILGFLGFGTQTSKTIVVSGTSLNGVTDIFYQDNIPELKGLLKDYVYPIVDEERVIIGTAFRYGGQTITALHTVVTASPKRPLFIYDRVSDTAWPITGYAPSRRDTHAVNSIGYFDDFSLLQVPQLEGANSFLISDNPITEIFQYLELSYPRDNTALKDPSAFSSHLAHSKTDKDGIVLLNRGGQSFNSSGGPIIEVKSQQARALNICIERDSNAVKAIDLYNINAGINEALNSGFIPSLAEIKYNFTYSEKCPPIGGRGSGP